MGHNKKEPLCKWGDPDWGCDCTLIAEVRADEREKAARRVMDALIDSTGADTEAVWTIVCDSIPEERRGGIEQGVVLTITGAIATIAATAARGEDK